MNELNGEASEVVEVKDVLRTGEITSQCSHGQIEYNQ